MPANKKMAAPALALALLATASAQSITTTAGPSIKSSSTEMRLAKKYQGNDFFGNFDFETQNDPTGGYVNYVSQDYAQAQGLISVESDGSVLIRADSSKPGQGRGRDSVRLASKDEFADGVYILDVNHMPVGCGVWPAWWTTVKNGWPKGGEIDIVEGANALPKQGGTAWQATGNITTPQAATSRNVASLHTADTCTAEAGTYQTGTLESPTCSAYMNGNQGCGVQMGGNTTFGVESFGSQVNDINGGWYAMWRDMANSGGAYVWFWPRNSPNVPDDVRNPSTTATNVAGWGQPAANLTTGCKSDFSNHVIVFNIAFCGDYSAATFGISGCPTTQNCPTFVQANPQAFTETYWSINSLRVYNAQGRPASGGGGLSKGAIAGIVVGAVAGVAIIGLLFWRYRSSKKRRLGFEPSEEELNKGAVGFTSWAGPGDDTDVPGKVQKIAPLLSLKKPRVGPTNLAPGKTARHQLDGETSANFYHEVADDLDYTPRTSDVALDDVSRRGSTAPSIKAPKVKQQQQPRSTVQPRNAPVPSSRYSVSQPSPAHSSFAQMASGQRGSAFNGEGSKGWVG